MGIIEQVRSVLKDHLVIRHRNGKELQGDVIRCIICHRSIVLPSGSLCLAVDHEGAVCGICGKIYAPEMTAALEEQWPSPEDSGVTVSEAGPMTGRSGLSLTEWQDLARQIGTLSEVTSELAKGIARGIVEAPAGHIGLMHYAKEIRKPQRKEGESDKNYELRVRTHRMTYLFRKIEEDTTGRVEIIRNYLKKLGMPE